MILVCSEKSVVSLCIALAFLVGHDITECPRFRYQQPLVGLTQSLFYHRVMVEVECMMRLCAEQSLRTLLRPYMASATLRVLCE